MRIASIGNSANVANCSASMAELPRIPLAYGARVRPSPYFEATLKHNPGSFSVYNRMMMPFNYQSIEDAYWDLTERVSVWDVGCERQVEITGPDAAVFTQYLVTRDVTKIKPGRARYTLVCQDDGGILNDPVLVRLSEDHFWLSLADSDILLWAKGVAHNSGFEVHIEEPDVSPIQIQGPRSPDLMRDIFGDSIDELAFYQFHDTSLEGVPMLVARTGWSGEAGFEIFLRDGTKGGFLWDRLFEAGAKHGVRPGAPNPIRRLEAGLLSWGTDMDWRMNPYEMGLDKFVDIDSEDDFIGRAALERVKAEGPEQRLTGVFIEGDPIREMPVRWWPVHHGEAEIGFVTSAIWTPGMERNIGFALLDSERAASDLDVMIDTPGGRREAATTQIPFVGPRYRD